MDLNIGAALWLAGQAEGPLLLHSPGRPSAASPKTSSAAAPADKEPTCSPPEHSQGSRTGSISDAEAERSEQPSSRGEAASSAHQEGDPSQIRSGMEEARRYRSRARVVLLGHGADELCAGYGRHRTRFRSHVRLSSHPVALHPPSAQKLECASCPSLLSEGGHYSWRCLRAHLRASLDEKGRLKDACEAQ